MRKILFITTMLFLLTTSFCSGETVATPTNFTGIETTPGTITFSWTDNSNNEDGFLIEEYNTEHNLLTSQIGWQRSFLAPANSTSYTYKTTFSWSKRKFRITAYKGKHIAGFFIPPYSISSKIETTVDGIRPDLTISNFSLDNTTITPGSNINVSCTISNIGNHDMIRNAEIYFYYSTSPTATYTAFHNDIIEILPIGSKCTKNVTLSTPSGYVGSYYIQCIVANNVELTRQNNSSVIQLQILDPDPKPDLTISSAIVKGQQGTTVLDNSNNLIPVLYSSDILNYIDINYKNQGTSNANDPSIIRTYISSDATLNSTDLPMCETTIPKAVAGSSYNTSMQLDLFTQFPYKSSGYYYLITKIDADSYFDEKSEANNTVATKVWINYKTNRVINEELLKVSKRRTDITNSGEINIFPNPSNGEFSVKLDKDSYTEIMVCNVTGQCVYTEKLNSISAIKLNLSELSNGVYTIYITDGKNTIAKKVIIQKL